MCDCDEERGKIFLPHQLSKGKEFESQEPISVTIGFQPRVCDECRGIPIKANPVASGYGRTSKIVRYYWRELFFREAELFGEWLGQQEGEVDEWGAHAIEMKEEFHKLAREEIKALHETAPKYHFAGISQAESIRRYGVQVDEFKGTYVREEMQKKARVLDGAEPVSVEEFVKRHFEREGYQVMMLESRPLHVLFGTFMFLLVQDCADPKVRTVMFGDRQAFDRREPSREIWTSLPSDFGTEGYRFRRTREIESHLVELPAEKEEWIWRFDYWLEPSANFRQYLWAHRSEDVIRARTMLDILPVEAIRRILRYLVENYWERYLGWPDLLISRESEIRFVEVKSSKDKLSEDQQRWIQDNGNILGFDFSIAKVHRG